MSTIIHTPEQGHWKQQGNHQVWVVDVPAVTHQQAQTVTSYSPLSLTDADNGNVQNLKDASGNQANCYTSISVGSNRTLVLPSGTAGIWKTYFINGGDLNVQGSLSCDMCTIVLTNQSSASPIGNIKVNASATINMTAPADGKYAGLALYQDRRATDCNQCNKINGKLRLDHPGLDLLPEPGARI